MVKKSSNVDDYDFAEERRKFDEEQFERFNPEIDIEEVIEDDNIFYDTDSLSQEVKDIRELKRKGWGYKKIAEKYGRSIYWVYSRCDPKYIPKSYSKSNIDLRGHKGTITDESRFTSFISKILVSNGHDILNVRAKPPIPDIITNKDNKIHVWELKHGYKHNLLATGFGQCVMYKYFKKNVDYTHLCFFIGSRKNYKKNIFNTVNKFLSKYDVKLHIFVEEENNNVKISDYFDSDLDEFGEVVEIFGKII